MKNRIYIVVLVLVIAFLSSITSCNRVKVVSGNGKVISEVRSIEKFDAIEISGMFQVYLTQDSISSLSIVADENLMECISAEVKNNVLEIKSLCSIIKSKSLDIYISTPKITAIDISGATEVTSTRAINGDKLELNISGASYLNLTLNYFEVELESSGSSQLAFTGTVNNADFDISGSCEMNALELTADNMIIESSGSTNAMINVVSNLEVHISGSGNIEYIGNPSLKQEVSGSGKIINIK